MTIRSMTGYGYGEAQQNGKVFVCEVRSLNSRYLEIQTRTPKYLMFLDTEILNFTKTKLSRGKVDIFIDIRSETTKAELPELDADALAYYCKLSKAIKKKLEQENVINQVEPQFPTVHDFLTLQGVLSQDGWIKTVPMMADTYRKSILTAVDKALNQLLFSREKEGGALKKELQTLVENFRVERMKVTDIEGQYKSKLATAYQQKIDAVLKKIADHQRSTDVPFSNERLLMEVAILLEKADVNEELTRIAVHEKEFLRLLDSSEPMGRKLDFLCQELNREVNTLSNKLITVEMSKATINMRHFIEQLRQQVQNIE